MSRHRDIRNMDYSEDYDGYDDVYGHSVDDDIYISPSHRQFMYNRENSGQSKNDYLMEEDIQEEDETEEELKLSEEDKAKLDSCLEHVKSVFKPMRMPRHEIVKVIIGQKFDSEKIVDSILKSQCTPPTGRRDKDQTISLLNSSKQACLRSINSKNLPLTLQNVEPQSKVNVDLLNTLNSLQLKNKNNVLYSERGLYGNDSGPSTSDRRISKEQNKDSNISFLSKMKKINDNSKKKGPNSPSASFLSKMKLHSKETDMEVNKSPKIFLSRINMQGPQGNDNSNYFSPSLQENSKNKTVNLGNLTKKTLFTKSSENLKIDHSPLRFKPFEEIEKDSSEHNNSFTFKLPLNGVKNTINANMNLFLDRMALKETLNSPQESRSDNSFTTHRTLPKDFSKLKLTEVHSLPTLGGNKKDDGFNINLITAVQKNNLDNLKFRPTASEEQFDIPFVDCECDDERLDDGKINLLECTMDISPLATKTLFHCKKRPSPLGRAFCLKYRIPKAKKFKKERLKLDPKLVIFDFKGPSPDDQIKKHMKRYL